MRILGIIPSRFGSTRFPGKPLIDIEGKSMIQRVYQQAIQSSCLSNLIVATDDNRIFNHVVDFGGHVIMTSSKHQNGTERCGEVISTIVDEYDFVVNIQGDEPFISPDQIDLLCTNLDQDIEVATLVKQEFDKNMFTNPNCIKAVFDNLDFAIYFSRSGIPYSQNRSENDGFFKHIGIYAYRFDILKTIAHLPPGVLELAESLEQLRWLENGFKIKILETFIQSQSIDTPNDLEKLIKNINLINL
ncbi:MAG: 3-deoxy-manno-octulosonate cytidylyltransferase [Bacteroidetes bacterium]|nr:3-deoxy-manno-octulosonate cytidylyltransferase [Bacteroidota bacterium]MDA1119095.1 3-deoxy-manno-octulosonate cytidylyltransferase [Bacteroidota bacterium]